MPRGRGRASLHPSSSSFQTQQQHCFGHRKLRVCHREYSQEAKPVSITNFHNPVHCRELFVVPTTNNSTTTMKIAMGRRYWSSAVSLAPMLVFALVALTLPATVTGRAVLGIDLGSLYMKVALVKSGSPLQIVTNMHSKRKTEQMVLFDQQQRFYGADANGLLQRKAQFTPSSMSEFLGRDVSHPNVKVGPQMDSPQTMHDNL